MCWYYKCTAVVRWDNVLSQRFIIQAGVRQGGVLSPYLFALYIDSLIQSLTESQNRFYLCGVFMGCIVYADDILLISNSICDMQQMLNICSRQAYVLNVEFNAKKSVALRIGPRFMVKCSALVLCGTELKYANTLSYLGITVKSGRKWSCLYDDAKCSFYRCFNAIYCKSRASNSELTSVYLLRNICVSVITYAIEASGPTRSICMSLDNAVDNAIRKIFNVCDVKCVQLIRSALELHNV